MPYLDKPSFRCRLCSHLQGPESAGVRPTPSACAVCGKSDWEVLADAAPDRLAELGLTAADVCAHTPDHDRDAAENLERCRAALAGLKDKEAAWKLNREAVIAEVHALDDKHDALAAKGPVSEDHADIDKHTTELARLRQKADDLVNSEWTERDAAHKAELEAAIARGGRPLARPPVHARVNAADRSKTFDRA